MAVALQDPSKAMIRSRKSGSLITAGVHRVKVTCGRGNRVGVIARCVDVAIRAAEINVRHKLVAAKIDAGAGGCFLQGSLWWVIQERQAHCLRCRNYHPRLCHKWSQLD